MKTLILALAFVLASCSNKVLVKKETCKEVFDGALLECEKVEK